MFCPPAPSWQLLWRLALEHRWITPLSSERELRSGISPVPEEGVERVGEGIVALYCRDSGIFV